MRQADTPALTILAAAKKAPQRWLGLSEHLEPPPKGVDRAAVVWSGLEPLTLAGVADLLEEAQQAWPDAEQYDMLACDILKPAPPLSTPEMKTMREAVVIATLPAPAKAAA